MGWWKYRVGECSWGEGLVKVSDFERTVWGWFVGRRWGFRRF